MLNFIEEVSSWAKMYLPSALIESNDETNLFMDYYKLYKEIKQDTPELNLDALSKFDFKTLPAFLECVNKCLRMQTVLDPHTDIPLDIVAAFMSFSFRKDSTYKYTATNVFTNEDYTLEICNENGYISNTGVLHIGNYTCKCSMYTMNGCSKDSQFLVCFAEDTVTCIFRVSQYLNLSKIPPIETIVSIDKNTSIVAGVLQGIYAYTNSYDTSYAVTDLIFKNITNLLVGDVFAEMHLLNDYIEFNHICLSIDNGTLQKYITNNEEKRR